MSLDLNKKDKFFGRTVSEYIRTVPGELPVDAVGMWQIVPTGRISFELKNDDLREFVYKCIVALLKQGAKPVTGGKGTRYEWILQPRYGEEIEEIADAVMAEWITSGESDCDPGGLWFALPSSYVGYVNEIEDR